MKPFHFGSMSFDGNTFSILDQTQLPHRTEWLSCESVDNLVEYIQRLAIRGAPAIGISASILLALLAENGTERDQLTQHLNHLLTARPTAVNLRNNLETIRKAIGDASYPESVVTAAEKIYQEDRVLCENIARNGARGIEPGEKILTHCNTGSLATAGSGTAMAVIAEAARIHGDIFVWVDETRPLLQGGRLTAWECSRLGIDHAIICDSAAAMLMAGGEVDRIIVGADRIAKNGDFANKIGTYGLAALAAFHNIPFYVAAPHTTIDAECADGKSIPIEMRGRKEIHGVHFEFGSCSWSPPASPAFNPAFDMTPAQLVTAWILDTGCYSAEDLGRESWWNPK